MIEGKYVMGDQQRTVSLVVPVFNEETNILPFYEACSRALVSTSASMEIVFVDDGSTDATYTTIQELSQRDPRVRGLSLSRNFGSHAAILAGLEHARGAAVVIISVDLQDPPDLIPELLQRWKEGFHVVWAVRNGRDDPWSKRLFAQAFYWVLRKTALPNYPRTGMDFGLFDRRVVEVLSRIQESNPFITGLILWLGFRQTSVPYHRRARHSGTSKWPFWKRIKAALDAMVSFSYFPIRFISFFGMAVALLSLVYAAITLAVSLTTGQSAAGYPSLMVTVLFLGGVQLITLGVLGEYIWRGNDQGKGRPRYIVMDKTGVSDESSLKG